MTSLCIVQPVIGRVSETFITAHAERLPAQVTVVSNLFHPEIGGTPLLSHAMPARGWRKVKRLVMRREVCWEITEAYMAAFRQCGAQAVLAEYGTTGVRVMEAARVARLPLIVHFHGYDASRYAILKQYGDRYREMFRQASAVVAVSRAMRRRLIRLGAPPQKVYYNPYGVDPDRFRGADPHCAPPILFGVGRFVEKKAPHLTLLAFRRALQEVRDARLRIVGDGVLLAACRDLAVALGIENRVDFLGAQPNPVVQDEMRTARAFVQHSVTARDGDSEGTPVGILEASCTGLPVISTRHAGIPDTVIDEETGLLVDERDVKGMADNMCRVLKDPALAARLGAAGQRRIHKYFSMEQSINRLASIVEGSISGAMPPVEWNIPFFDVDREPMRQAALAK